ncbi:unnamed protein product [Allacma fusca]|uniref:Uncharacterized protein n=1 Tax=Allacma fusca TaxID=39272 RepID=A0A8J2PBB7_9HEXA|nr:unnamed protein product [Allacma fusca]
MLKVRITWFNFLATFLYTISGCSAQLFQNYNLPGYYYNTMQIVPTSTPYYVYPMHYPQNVPETFTQGLPQSENTYLGQSEHLSQQNYETQTQGPRHEKLPEHETTVKPTFDQINTFSTSVPNFDHFRSLKQLLESFPHHLLEDLDHYLDNFSPQQQPETVTSANSMKELLESFPQNRFENPDHYQENFSPQPEPQPQTFSPSVNYSEAKTKANEDGYVHLYPVEQGKYFEVDLGEKENNGTTNANRNNKLYEIDGSPNSFSIFQESLHNGNVAFKQYDNKNSPIISVIPSETINESTYDSDLQLSDHVKTIPEVIDNKYYTTLFSSLFPSGQFEHFPVSTDKYSSVSKNPGVMLMESVHGSSGSLDVEAVQKLLTTTAPTTATAPITTVNPNYLEPQKSISTLNYQTSEIPVTIANFEQPRVPEIPIREQMSRNQNPGIVRTSSESSFKFPSFSDAKKMRKYLRPQPFIEMPTTGAPQNSVGADNELMEEQTMRQMRDFDSQRTPLSKYVSASPVPGNSNDHLAPALSPSNDERSVKQSSSSLPGPPKQLLRFRNPGVRKVRRKYKIRKPVLASTPRKNAPSLQEKTDNFNNIQFEDIGNPKQSDIIHAATVNKLHETNIPGVNVPPKYYDVATTNQLQVDTPYQFPAIKIVPAPNLFPGKMEQPRVITRVTSSVRAVQSIPTSAQNGFKQPNVNAFQYSSRPNRITSGSNRWKSWSSMQLRKIASYINRVSRRFQESIGAPRAQRFLRNHPLYQEAVRRKRKARKNLRRN